MDHEFDRLYGAGAEVFEAVDAHVRNLWHQPIDEAWREGYERLKSRYQEADREFRDYSRAHWTCNARSWSGVAEGAERRRCTSLPVVRSRGSWSRA